MRIAINGRFLTQPPLEGVGSYTFHMIKHFIELKQPDDELFVFYDRQPHEQYLFDGNVIPIILAPKARHFLAWIRYFEYAIPKQLKKHKIEVFFSPDGHTSLQSDIPCINTVHDLAFEHYPQNNRLDARIYFKLFFRRFCKKADRLIAISNATKQDLLDLYDTPASKVDVVYNGLDEHFKPIEKRRKQTVLNEFSDGIPYFLYVGSIHPRKNVLSVIKAYERFRTSNIDSNQKLMLVGRFAWRYSDVKKAIKSSTYKEDIVHLSDIKSEVYNLVASAEALLYLSLYEGFGLPIIEALACGVPVITSNLSAMKEIGSDSALLVDPLDEKSIAATMKCVLDTNFDSDRKRWITYAHSFSWRKSAQRVLQVIHSMR